MSCAWLRSGEGVDSVCGKEDCLQSNGSPSHCIYTCQVEMWELVKYFYFFTKKHLFGDAQVKLWSSLTLKTQPLPASDGGAKEPMQQGGIRTPLRANRALSGVTEPDGGRLLPIPDAGWYNLINCCYLFEGRARSTRKRSGNEGNDNKKCGVY